MLKQLYLDSRFLDPRRADLGADAGRGRRGARHAPRHGARGQLTVLMITHKFREVMAFADEVTVLRRGQLAGGGRGRDLLARCHGEDDGRRPSEIRQAWTARASLGEGERSASSIDGLTAEDDDGLPAVRGVSLAVHAGEIVGHCRRLGQRAERAGPGAGRSARRDRRREVRIHGQALPREARRDARHQGVAACPRSRCAMPACPRMTWPRTWPSGASTSRRYAWPALVQCAAPSQEAPRSS